MAIATQFSVALGNRPGTLARLCDVLLRRKVNIIAVSVSEASEHNWVRLVATPATGTKAALLRAGYPLFTSRVLLLEVAHRPGTLATIASRLAKARINIQYVYGSNGDGPTSTLVLGVSEPARAARILAE